MKRIPLLVAVTLAWSVRPASGLVTNVQYHGSLDIWSELPNTPPYPFYTEEHHREMTPYVASLTDTAAEPGVAVVSATASQAATFGFAPDGQWRSLGFQGTASASVLTLADAWGQADADSYLNMDFTVAGNSVPVRLTGTRDGSRDPGYMGSYVFLFKVVPGLPPGSWIPYFSTNVYTTLPGPFEADILLDPGLYQLAAGAGVRAEVTPGYTNIPFNWARLDLTFTIVPEPLSLALLGIGGLLTLPRPKRVGGIQRTCRLRSKSER